MYIDDADIHALLTLWAKVYTSRQKNLQYELYNEGNFIILNNVRINQIRASALHKIDMNWEIKAISYETAIY